MLGVLVSKLLTSVAVLLLATGAANARVCAVANPPRDTDGSPGYLNLREGPSIKSPIKAIIPADSKMELEYTTEDGWSSTYYGWVRTKFIVVVDCAEPVVAPPASQTPPAPVTTPEIPTINKPPKEWPKWLLNGHIIND
jgi:hypothetical protein